MINLYKTNQPVRNNDRPEHPAENTINDKTDASYHIDNPDFSHIFQDEAQYNKQRCRIADIGSSFGVHDRILEDHKLNHFQEDNKIFSAIKSFIGFW